jgi:hypothetical protein
VVEEVLESEFGLGGGDRPVEMIEAARVGGKCALDLADDLGCDIVGRERNLSMTLRHLPA